MKRTREDLASTRRVIGGGRGIGKLEPFVPRWEQCTAREVCLVPGLGTVLTATRKEGGLHRPQATGHSSARNPGDRPGDRVQQRWTNQAAQVPGEHANPANTEGQGALGMKAPQPSRG